MAAILYRKYVHLKNGVSDEDIFADSDDSSEIGPSPDWAYQIPNYSFRQVHEILICTTSGVPKIKFTSLNLIAPETLEKVGRLGFSQIW